MIYKCKVINSLGKKNILKIEGYSHNEVIDFLKKDNYAIIDVRKIKYETFSGYNSFSNIIKGSSKLNSKELSLFCKQLSSMLKSKITILHCIEILHLQIESKKLKKILNIIHKELLTGNTFSESLTNHKSSFPEIFISMITAGELSGNMESVMTRLSEHYQREYKIENKLKSAMTYPIILSIVSTAVVILLLIKVMPTFVSIYESSNVQLPFATTFLLNISKLIKNSYHIIILIIFLIILAQSKLKKNKAFRLRYDKFKLNIPVYKNMQVKIAAARFTRTLSTLLINGINLLEALQTASSITGNSFIEFKILEIKEDVRNGISLSESIKQKNIFPVMVYSMIGIGEESGLLEELLDKTAFYYDEETENAVNKFISLIEPLMIIIMAVLVGGIMIAMLTPMFDMIKMVQ